MSKLFSQKCFFFVPDYAPGILLLKLSGLNSIESETPVKRPLLLARLITQPKIVPAVKTLFESRIIAISIQTLILGFFVHISELLKKYNLNTCSRVRIIFSRLTMNGKNIVYKKILYLLRKSSSYEFSK